MIIREDELLNLKSCPLKYKIGHAGYDVQKKTYNTFLHELFNYMVSYYHFHGKDGLIESAEKKWADTYVSNLNIISEKRWLEGVSFILNIYNHITNEKFKTIDANMQYTLEFPETGCAVTGTINMVAEYGPQIIIVDPAFSNTEIDRHMIDWDLRYTMHSMAIKQMFNKITVIKKHNYKTNKESIALRTDNHFKTLELIVNNANQIIKNDLLIPDYGYHCSTCAARGICSGWGIQEIKPYNTFKDGRKH